MPILFPKGLGRCEDALGVAAPTLAIGPEATFPPESGPAQVAFREVVRRLDPIDVYERPEGRFDRTRCTSPLPLSPERSFRLVG